VYYVVHSVIDNSSFLKTENIKTLTKLVQ